MNKALESISFIETVFKAVLSKYSILQPEVISALAHSAPVKRLR